MLKGEISLHQHTRRGVWCVVYGAQMQALNNRFLTYTFNRYHVRIDRQL